MLRITAMDTHPLAAEYLLRAAGCAEAKEQEKAVAAAAAAGDAVAYYQAAESNGEAPGRWRGRAAELLGFMPGDVANPDDVRVLLGELKDPRTGEHLGARPKNYRTFEQIMAEKLRGVPADLLEERRRELYNEVKREARRACGFFDATYSAPKSVSVYHAALRAEGRTAEAEAVSAAHRAGVEAAMRYLEENGTWVRRGKHTSISGRGVGRRERGTGMITVEFDHSTSRAEDPHLHTHVAIVNKTQATSDGKWLSVDNKQWRHVKAIAASIYESVMAAEIETATDARFEVRADGLGREIAGFTDRDLQESSGRTEETLAEQARMLREFEQQQGRPPTAAERRQIHRQAGLQSRASKSHRSPEEQLQAWSERDDVDPRRYLRQVREAGAKADRERKGQPKQTVADLNALVGRALAETQAASAVWNRAELVARLANSLALHQADDEQTCTGLAETLADKALAPGSPFGVVELTRPDPTAVPDWWRHAETGKSIFLDPIGGTFALRSHLSTEQALVADSRRSGARSLPVGLLRQIEAELTSGPRPLGEDQAAVVVGILGSGRMADVIVAPAGTGKSYTAGKLTELWQREHRGRVLGVATSQRAAKVLAEDGIEESWNSTQFLMRFDPVSAGPGQVPTDELTSRDLVIVDEAGMSTTAELARIQQLAAAAGAKVVFQGDPRQLAAVGAGGALQLLADDNGAFELEEVRRFRNDWEGTASTRLRDGDTTALDLYEDHGRIRSGSADRLRHEAVTSYVADVLQGTSAVIVCQTNDDAAEMSAQVQARLMRVGRVQGPIHGSVSLMDGNRAHHGDLLQARRNDWSNTSTTGTPVINRDLYEVLTVSPTGAVIARAVDRDEDVVTLDAAYLSSHCALGYAGTEHAVQGVTVDHCYAMVPGYVAMTRGREQNIVFVETERDGSAEKQRLRTSARTVLEQAFSQDGREAAAVQVMRDEIAASQDLTTVAHYWDLVQEPIAADRHAQMVAHHLGDELAERLLVTDEAGHFDRSDGFEGLLESMRRAELQGHDVEALLAESIEVRSFAGANDVAKVLRSRFDRRAADATPNSPGTWENRGYRERGPLGEFESELTRMMDAKQTELGAQLAAAPPRWALDTIGPVPTDEQQLAEWKRRAGLAGAYRHVYGIPEHQTSIGAPPASSDVLRRVWWEDAARAAGRPTDALDYQHATDADLEVIVARWERAQAWAPAYVAYEQGTAHEAAQAQAAEATVLAAEAVAEEDPERRAELQEQAERARRIADRMAVRAELLDSAAEVRQQWERHTEADRDAAEAARAEMENRGLGEKLVPILSDAINQALFELADENGVPLETRRDQQEQQGQDIEQETSEEEAVLVDEHQATLFEIEPTARQQAEREAAEVDLDTLDAEPTVAEAEADTLADVLRRAEIAAELMERRTEEQRRRREQAEQEEAARAERFRRQAEEQKEVEQVLDVDTAHEVGGEQLQL